MTVGGWRVGVGGDVNVPCDLLSLLMVRPAGVGWGGEVAFPVLREPWNLLKHL